LSILATESCGFIVQGAEKDPTQKNPQEKKEPNQLPNQPSLDWSGRSNNSIHVNDQQRPQKRRAQKEPPQPQLPICSSFSSGDSRCDKQTPSVNPRRIPSFHITPPNPKQGAGKRLFSDDSSTPPKTPPYKNVSRKNIRPFDAPIEPDRNANSDSNSKKKSLKNIEQLEKKKDA
jgi:hypothetical protein